jgi:small subunit ribosomal protein S13
MLIIFGKKINENKKLRYALTDLYGIGVKQAFDICAKLSLSKNLKVKDLTELQKLNISKYIKQNLTVENYLKQQIQHNVNKYIENSSLRGFRYRSNLPVRGQRTHSNAKSCRVKRI